MLEIYKQRMHKYLLSNFTQIDFEQEKHARHLILLLSYNFPILSICRI